MALPDSVREVIGARVGRLGTGAERVLSMAAVIGRDFDLDLLARATKTTEDELLDILEAAAAVALVRELADAPGHYNFAHALIQHTLYEDLGPTRRARAHRQVAEALEDLCGDRPGARVGELARHWFSATQPIDWRRPSTTPARRAMPRSAALAPADALRYYAQALDLYPQATDPDPVLGIDLAIGLGTAQRQTGDPAFRDTLLGACSPGGRPRRHRATGGRRPGQQPRLVQRRRRHRHREGRDPGNGPRPGLGGPALTGRSCSPPCVPNFPLAARSTAARHWPTRQSPSPRPPATTPSSCGS